MPRPSSEAEVALRHDGLSITLSQLPVWLSAHRACLSEYAPFLRARILPPESMRPCPDAYLCARSLLFLCRAWFASNFGLETYILSNSHTDPREASRWLVSS